METSTLFAFYYPESAEDLHLTYPSLEVYWQVPVNVSQPLYDLYDGHWGNYIFNNYKSAIIKDIGILE